MLLQLTCSRIASDAFWFLPFWHIINLLPIITHLPTYPNYLVGTLAAMMSQERRLFAEKKCRQPVAQSLSKMHGSTASALVCSVI